jgi:DNA polymerase I-like protein with 3'-5' exonuclease and polymerase domains
MSKRVMCLDFETYDPYITRGLGGGWAFKRLASLEQALETDEFSVLCAATKSGTRPAEITALEDLQALLNRHDVLIAHNAAYELGILTLLGVKFDHLLVVDTLLLGKIKDNRLMSYSLDALAKQYLNSFKSDEPLGQVAVDLNLVKSKVQNPVTVAKKHMHRVYEANAELVHEYAKQDVELTYALAQKFKEHSSVDQLEDLSDLLKCVVESRWKGVRIDLHRADEVREILLAKEQEIDNKLETYLQGCNINSPKQLGEAFDRLGLTYPLTQKGSPSFTKAWLEANQDIEVCQLIVSKRKYEKARRDFIESAVKSQEYVDREVGDEGTRRRYGRVYPEINIFGAAATGRASSSNPNIQQIPKRDKEIGPLVRSIYVPEQGEQWYSLDFSSQESRIQVHYAAQIGAPGVGPLVEGYRNDEKFDLHAIVANMAGVSRDEAKVINLGISYGMGLDKLAKTLQQKRPEAMQVYRNYISYAPYLDELKRVVSKRMTEVGRIRTIGGRYLFREKGFEYKALNKLIQGSAADQTYRAMIDAYRAGIGILFPVHDSIEVSAADSAVIKKLKHIMETSTPMLVPSKSDVEQGYSWGDLSPWTRN